MADEPSPTRWSFQDFKTFYDGKFGRKKAAEAASDSQQNGQTTVVASNGNGRVNNSSDTAIYEQYRNQYRNSTTHSNGVLSNGVNERPKKSLLPAFDSAETRALAESLCRDIIRGSPDVKWESIKGLENAKRLLKEAVVMPIKYPKYFTGLLSPWKGILLFGPPGTGKTMLAKAVATECKTTFFNISASSVVSKWRGAAFENSAFHFFHCILQMDGLTCTDELVFVLAATNLPWELDAAMLRRLEKRVSFDIFC
ncbi:katanin p60 ATPase-containing subunit A-like 2 [Populus alba x Populus x berolinensis]|nr:katanin p60 ATPase-containing subunit A-like 2 [Populus alba x Populus x berolinensis]